MTEPEWLSIAQNSVLQALNGKECLGKYIADPNDQNRYNLFMCFTKLISNSNSIIEDIHRKEFAASVTERIEAVERNGHR